ncbi:N-acetylmuramoyl-L-alanine amidase AmpD [hydrothermal vent metagenome]|uniref:1,6-anhydro-N-acetylmuramyl-L-alanine amidase AmpD n=1 Tax=hydrothermal vent metagenome TaxID=652676 RepID=A0A1W1C9A3_9ZZZZ
MSALLTWAKQISSPNFDDRKTKIIDLLVIHNISLPPAEFGNNFIEDFFTNQLDKNAHPYFKKIYDVRVSAHLLIKRTGEVIQFVPFDKRAWHAGVSNFQGREKCNDFSIGIELEGTDNLAFEEVQYIKLVKAIKELKQHYPIKNIVGHSDIAPERKTDPGKYFDWERLDEVR